MAFDPYEIARGAIAGAPRSSPSLVPTMPTALTLPARPAYTEPAKEAFDWDVPMSERPRGAEGWIWNKSRWAKENFDKEQQAKADSTYKQFQLDLAAWQDEAERKQREHEQQIAQVKNYYDTQGLIAPLAGDPTPIIRQAQSEWQKAQATGSQQAMDYWHNVAEQARIGAGWGSGGIDGSLTAGLMSLAGTPTAEAKMNQDKFEYLKEQDANDNAVALAKASSGGGSGNTSTPAPVTNPFGDTGSPAEEKINGYPVSRVDGYINNLAGQMNNDPNKILQYVQSTKRLNSDFQQAAIARLYQRARQ